MVEERKTSPSRVVFGPFDADLRTGELRKNGRRLRLSKQPFQVLAMLLETPGELVTRQELKSRLWPEDTFVDFDDSLNAAVNKLRQVLGDSAGNPKLIETLHGRGYRFIAPVEPEGEPALGGTAASVAAAQEYAASRFRKRDLAWALLAAGLAIALYFKPSPPRVVELPLRRFSFQPENLITGRTARPVISPNGRHVAYVVQDGNRTRLAVYDLGLGQSRELEGTQDARAPFWSPESDFIGFFAVGVLKKIRVEGGAAVSLSRVPLQSQPAGSWSASGDSIIISGMGLQRIPAGGGALTTIGETKFYLFPHYSLPLEASSRGVVFSRAYENWVMLQNLKTGEQEFLATGAFPTYSLSGHLIYQTRVKAGGLWALPFSLDSLKSTGEAIPIAQNGFYPSVASDGTLVYVDQPELPQRQLVWRDRNGKKLGVIGQPQRAMEFASMSPDGRYVAVTAQEGGNTDIWLHDVLRSTRERFTFDPAIDSTPTWSPDSSRVVFSSGRNQNRDLFIKPADGHADAEQLLATPSNEYVHDWSPDGRVLSYHKNTGFGADLWSLELSQDESDNKATLYLQTTSVEHSSKFSRDGRYLAYLSRESGRDEVYVRTFPEAQGKRQVSFNGGVQPRWSRDGKELFYVEGETLIAVSVTTEPRFEAGKAKRLFSDPNLTWQERTMPQYDVSPDGQRFVMIEPVGRSRPVIRIVQNWYEEFRDREQD